MLAQTGVRRKTEVLPAAQEKDWPGSIFKD